MTPTEMFDLQAGFSFLVFGFVVIWSGHVLRRLNMTCAHRPPLRFYSVFSVCSIAFGVLTFTFGAALAGNAVLGVV